MFMLREIMTSTNFTKEHDFNGKIGVFSDKFFEVKVGKAFCGC